MFWDNFDIKTAPAAGEWNVVNRHSKSYAKATTSKKTALSVSESDQETSFLPPLFLFNRACPMRVTNLDICQAAAKFLGYNGVAAAQRFGPSWHLFPKSKKYRAHLVGKHPRIEGIQVEIFSKNSSELIDDYGQPIPSTKVIIDKAPLKVTNKTIEEALLNLGIKT